MADAVIVRRSHACCHSFNFNATGAQTRRFHHAVCSANPASCATSCSVSSTPGGAFGHLAAAVGDKQRGRMHRLFEMVAQTQLLADSTLWINPCSSRKSSAVYRRRLGLWFGDAQQIEQVICADCTGLLESSDGTSSRCGVNRTLRCWQRRSACASSFSWVVEFIANIPVRKSRFYHDYGESPSCPSPDDSAGKVAPIALKEMRHNFSCRRAANQRCRF